MRARLRATPAVYERARVREKSIKVYVGSFASRREAEFAAQEHRVTQRGINAGELPAAVDHKRTMGDALDAWLKAINDQRSHDEYESRMRLYARPTFDHQLEFLEAVYFSSTRP